VGAFLFLKIVIDATHHLQHTVLVMTSLTCSEILTRLGWTQTNLPNSVLHTFTAPKGVHPDAWRMHRVNQYLFTLCYVPILGADHYTVRLGMRDREIVESRW
jgi:hypothetical protein